METATIILPSDTLDALCIDIRKHLQDVCIEEYDRVKGDHVWDSEVSGEYETSYEECTIKIKYDIEIDFYDSLNIKNLTIEVAKVTDDDTEVKLNKEDINAIENISIF